MLASPDGRRRGSLGSQTSPARGAVPLTPREQLLFVHVTHVGEETPSPDSPVAVPRPLPTETAFSPSVRCWVSFQTAEAIQPTGCTP